MCMCFGELTSDSIRWRFYPGKKFGEYLPPPYYKEIYRKICKTDFINDDIPSLPRIVDVDFYLYSHGFIIDCVIIVACTSTNT